MRIVGSTLRSKYFGAELYAQGMIYTGLNYANIF